MTSPKPRAFRVLEAGPEPSWRTLQRGRVRSAEKELAYNWSHLSRGWQQRARSDHMGDVSAEVCYMCLFLRSIFFPFRSNKHPLILQNLALSHLFWESLLDFSSHLCLELNRMLSSPPLKLPPDHVACVDTIDMPARMLAVFLAQLS